MRALLIAMALCALACREQSGAQVALEAPKVAAEAPKAIADTKPSGLPARPERVDNVTIDPRPRCGPAADETEDTSRLSSPEIQQSVSVLNRALQDVERSSLGTTLDNERRAIIVVFHTDFQDYDGIQKRLVGQIAPLHVVLQPSCHARAKLAEVEQALLDGSWHPKAKDTRRGSWLDPSFSGYRVTIDDSAPDVAEALQHRFGDLVRVALGKPGRN